MAEYINAYGVFSNEWQECRYKTLICYALQVRDKAEIVNPEIAFYDEANAYRAAEVRLIYSKVLLVARNLRDNPPIPKQPTLPPLNPVRPPNPLIRRKPPVPVVKPLLPPR
jgi:hypothetical protein